MMRIFTIACCFLLSITTFAQASLPQDYFQSPMDIPLVLAGTFGELRANHFHSGIDIKTQQRTGLPVLAAATGYVSRIKIQRYGYGKALYIQHPNGYTTVYGHLEKFSPEIEAYVKKQQYAKESYAIELFPQKDELSVTQGELVAYSGDTGGAAGPHVHFEIRDSQQRPMNPMDFGIDIKDTQKPTINAVYVYPEGSDAHVNGSAKPKKLRLIPNGNGDFKTETFEAYGKIGFGIATIDKLDGAYNKDGVYRIKTFFNGNENFELNFQKFSFAESRYINRLIDYAHYQRNHKRIQKLFIEPNNKLSMYHKVTDNGYIQIKDSLDYSYKIEVQDFKGNTTVVRIPIQAKKLPEQEIKQVPKPTTPFFAKANQATAFDENGFDIYIPKGALFDDTYLDIKKDKDVFQIHHENTPLLHNITIGFDVSHYKNEDKSKLFIARISKWGTPYYSDTYKKKNRFTTRTTYFGNYKLVSDTVGPTIKPINFREGKWMSNYDFLKFKIDDALSGIDTYRATINGKFILTEYDYKTGLLIYDFNDDVISATENKLKIIVIDNVGNSTTFEGTFFRKN